MQHLRYITLVFLLSVSNVYSGNTIDSLNIAFSKAKSPAEKLSVLNRLFEAALPKDETRAMHYADRALTISEFADDEMEKGIALYNKGLYLLIIGKSNDARTYFNSALQIFKENENEIWIAKTYSQLGQVVKNNLEYEKALELFFKAMKIFEKTNNTPRSLGTVYNRIGGVYYDQGNYDKAFGFWDKNLRIREMLNDSLGLLSAYNNIGEIYRLSGDFEKALMYYNDAIAINTVLQKPTYFSIFYDNIGNIYLSTKQYDSAAKYLNKSLEVAKQEHDNKRVAFAYNSLGSLYLAMNDYNTAKKYFRIAEELGIKISSIEVLKESSLGLGKSFEHLNQYEEAYNYYIRFKQLSDSLSKLNSSEEIARLEMRLLFENKKQLNDIVQEKKEWIYFIIAIGLFFIIIVISWLYGRQKIRIKHSQTAKENLELERKRLEEEIDFKNRELATNVMYMVKKNELINHISEKLIKAKLRFKKENIPVAEEIIHTLQMNVDDQIWDTFEKHFEEVHKNFYSKLNEKYPKLTKRDLKLCALLRLHLSTKEIATIMHQNPASVEVARTRLRKKLNLSNTEINLVTFLSGI
jgi:tetratricopeptide (TPR) repeat protein/DNA-binding CsgD family transcriptional regulator